MSLIVHMKIPGALLLASDCRVTGAHRDKSGSFSYIVSDTEAKTFLVHPRLAFSFCGDADLNGVPVSFLLKKALPLLKDAKTTEDAASLLLNYFETNGYDRRPSFLISGFGEIPSVLDLPAGKNTWKEQFPDVNTYGVTTLGDNRIARDIVNSGTIDYHLFRISDAVRFVRLLLETTARVQSFQKTRQTVSEACDILLLTEEKAQWVLRSSDPCQL